MWMCCTNQVNNAIILCWYPVLQPKQFTATQAFNTCKKGEEWALTEFENPMMPKSVEDAVVPCLMGLYSPQLGLFGLGPFTGEFSSWFCGGNSLYLASPLRMYASRPIDALGPLSLWTSRVSLASDGWGPPRAFTSSWLQVGPCSLHSPYFLHSSVVTCQLSSQGHMSPLMSACLLASYGSPVFWRLIKLVRLTTFHVSGN